jgi:hypothetical protein
MNLELSEGDLKLLEMLLSKEEGLNRVEIHHCRYHEYKQYLKEREKQISSLLERVRSRMPAADRSA